MSTYQCRMAYCVQETIRAKDVCEECWAYRRHLLAQLVDLFIYLRGMLAPGSRKDLLVLNHSRAVAGQAPLNLTALDALDAARSTLESWAAYASTRAGSKEALSDRLAHRGSLERFRAAVEILDCHDHRFVSSFYAGDYVADLYKVHRRLVTLAAPCPTRKLQTACPFSDSSTVITRHTEEYAACLTCAATWAQSQIPTLESRPQSRVRA